jgi:hypothetical protein
LSRAAGAWRFAPALVALWLLAPAIVGRGSFFQRDIHWVWYPHVESSVRAVSQGAWPLWDPHPAFGLPALADPNYQLAYPTTWLNLLLPPDASYTLFVALHLLGAGLGAFRLGRCFGLSPAAAALGASAWTASGPLLSFVSLFHHFAGLAWTPWVLLALERTLAAPTARRAAVLGAVAGGQVLAGSGDLCLMTALLGAAAVARWLVASTPRGAHAGRAAGALVLAAGIGCSISAVQWLPTAAILKAGSRLALAPWANLYWSLHPATLMELVAPKLFLGLRLSPEARQLLFESREPLLASLYLGAPILALAVLGTLCGGPRRALLAGSAVAFLLCALGRHAFLYPLLIELPPFAMMRYPAKYMGPASLAICLLAGVGLDAWRRDWAGIGRRRAGWSSAGAAALGLALAAVAGWIGLGGAGGALAGEAAAQNATTRLLLGSGASLAMAALLALRAGRRSAPPPLTAALIVVAVGGLLPATTGVNALAPPALVAHRPAWSAGLNASSVPARLYVEPVPYPPEPSLAPAPRAWSLEWWWTLGVQDTMAPPIASRWGIDGSYDGDTTGLTPRAVAELSVALARLRGSPASLRLLRAGGVDYVVSLAERPWLVGPISTQRSVFNRPILVYRVPDTLPRAFVVDGVRRQGPEGPALLIDPGLDLTREVLLEGVPARAPDAAFRGRAQVLSRRADAVSLLVEASAPAHVVLLDGYAEGWHAEVDGRPAPVRRANLLFRAVEVEAGRHSIELRYRPGAVMLGATLSASGAALAIALAAVGAARRRAGPRPSGPRGPGRSGDSGPLEQRASGGVDAGRVEAVAGRVTRALRGLRQLVGPRLEQLQPAGGVGAEGHDLVEAKAPRRLAPGLGQDRPRLVPDAVRILVAGVEERLAGVRYAARDAAPVGEVQGVVEHERAQPGPGVVEEQHQRARLELGGEVQHLDHGAPFAAVAAQAVETVLEPFDPRGAGGDDECGAAGRDDRAGSARQRRRSQQDRRRQRQPDPRRGEELRPVGPRHAGGEHESAVGQGGAQEADRDRERQQPPVQGRPGSRAHAEQGRRQRQRSQQAAPGDELARVRRHQRAEMLAELHGEAHGDARRVQVDPHHLGLVPALRSAAQQWQARHQGGEDRRAQIEGQRPAPEAHAQRQQQQRRAQQQRQRALVDPRGEEGDAGRDDHEHRAPTPAGEHPENQYARRGDPGVRAGVYGVQAQQVRGSPGGGERARQQGPVRPVRSQGQHQQRGQEAGRRQVVGVEQVGCVQQLRRQQACRQVEQQAEGTVRIGHGQHAPRRQGEDHPLVDASEVLRPHDGELAPEHGVDREQDQGDARRWRGRGGRHARRS